MKAAHIDILVIGSGIAGLSFALKTAQRFPDCQIAILSKEQIETSNTWLAQGGIAAVMDEQKDSCEQHFRDTLKASQNTSAANITRQITHQAPRLIKELCDWGVTFDANENGTFNQAQEGAHAYPRVLHHKDHTGTEIVQKLLLALDSFTNVSFYPHHMVLDLITTGKNSEHPIPKDCQGAYVMDTKNQIAKPFSAAVTYLACGGAGQIFPHTTNAFTATGDALGLGLKAGLPVKKMAHYQFHPTVFYNGDQTTSFLLTEALRGAGATLRNENGESFMKRYHKQGDLAPRDIVTRAEFDQLKKSKGACLYLDALRIPEVIWKTRFPKAYERCRNQGYHPMKHWIPVIPAAHYQCGGIPVDESGKTPIKGLYAGGECAYSGFHGHNRLASNSLLEGMALADWSAGTISGNDLRENISPNPGSPVATVQKPSQKWIDGLKRRIKKQMHTVTLDSIAQENPDHLIENLDQVLKIWHDWQTEGYVLDKDFQESGNMLYAARAIVKDKIKNNTQSQPTP